MIFGNMGEMMKMAKEMKGNLDKIKTELEKLVFEGTAQGVTVKVNGEMDIKEIKIDPKLVDPGNISRLEKQVQEAATKALKTAKDEAARRMRGLTGGLGLPGMF